MAGWQEGHDSGTNIERFLRASHGSGQPFQHEALQTLKARPEYIEFCYHVKKNPHSIWHG